LKVTTVLVGYDGSPPSAAAIDVAARLLPEARATIAYIWTPPFANAEVRQRLWRRANNLDDLIALIEREGAAEAERLAADGAAIARAAGWDAKPKVSRGYGGEGYELARLARDLSPDVLILGSRGLGGVQAILGSTSDVAVHVSPVPVLVVPHPMLSAERAAAAAGPVVVGYDGSAGARTALTKAVAIFAGREFAMVTVSGLDVDPVEREVLKVAGMETAEVVVLEGRGRGERSVADAIARFAQDQQAAAIAVGSRGRSAAKEILLGSAAMAVLHRAQRPVLVVPHDRFA
jgi:nucleotide-binding universal stress UspA family protein